MKVKWSFLKRLHLDHTYGLLTARSAFFCYEAFKQLDWRGVGSLDDIQFAAFMMVATDLKEKQIYKVFDIFDLDRSGSVEFDEVSRVAGYRSGGLLNISPVLLACDRDCDDPDSDRFFQDNQGKKFMYQHWRTCFEILDEDGGRTVSIGEFSTLGFLFNFTPTAIRNIFKEFDVTGNMELDYSDFRLFVLAAIELQSRIDSQRVPLSTRIARAVQQKLNRWNIPFFKTSSGSITESKESTLEIFESPLRQQSSKIEETVRTVSHMSNRRSSIVPTRDSNMSKIRATSVAIDL